MSLLIIVVTFESEGGPPQGARDAVPRDETSRMPALPELKMPDFVDASSYRMNTWENVLSA